jgi:hypothetical protein
MMKKMLLVVLTVLAMAAVANAGLQISVKGVVNPPDTTVILYPSDIAIIDIHATQMAMMFFVMQGPGLLDISQLTYKWEQSAVSAYPPAEKAEYIAGLTEAGYANITDLIGIDVVDISDPITQPNGLVIDGLRFHCEGLGDVTLTLMDLDLNVFDSQVIHQIPEPITMVLLGLGGLFLRRRK